jgi:hypothetical protein
MTRIGRPLVLAAAGALLFVADFAPDGDRYAPGLGRHAAAVVGAPLTPVSVAGAARRTTRRVVAVEATAATAAATTAAASTAAQQQAVAQQQAAVAQQQAAIAQQQAAAAAAPAVGSVVAALPAGCTPTPKGGIEYQHCGNVWYRAAFQGNNLVYAVVPQP